ncbi:translation initiation factor IF-1 [Candidatus Roizmanbacteria bacterium RIFCSPLOWO2_01_FULL_45_11]|uniref:Translation initiation factor IF-1 n=1 Tax=Candidatus Roizmanbacteria bacterium RIFCSPLOWO2_01_FULL_45_11 TaxID=1802070 RepID=A0A1F7JHV9_9BACT|nr:MAG: translation initiation factor IF-1 [Candidatus Roizmanbacteria bacterium RIFCSPLOWO2_01_FULL_45_11]
MHQGTFEVEGEVTESLPNTMFRVNVIKAEDATLVGTSLLCHLSGKMRMHYIRVMPGDHVRIEMTPYDKGKGRIVYRFR